MNDRPTAGEYAALRAATMRGRRGATQKESAMGALFKVFPLILIPVLIYNFWAIFGGADPSAVREGLRGVLGEGVPMASSESGVGVNWAVTGGDVLVLIGLICLFVELLKSTSTGTMAIFNHALSMLVFILCLVEFLLHPAFATSTFFFLMVMSLLDVLAGVVVTIVAARRDVDFGPDGP